MQHPNLFLPYTNILNDYFLSKSQKTGQSQLKELIQGSQGFSGFLDPETFSQIYGEPVTDNITLDMIAYAINRYKNKDQPDWVILNEQGFLAINPIYVTKQDKIDLPEKRPIFNLQDHWYRFEENVKVTTQQITSTLKKGIQELPFLESSQLLHRQTFLERLILCLNVFYGCKTAKEKLEQLETIDYEDQIRKLNNYFPSIKVKVDETELELHQLSMLNFNETPDDDYLNHLNQFVSRLDQIKKTVTFDLAPFHQIKNQVEKEFKWLAMLDKQFAQLKKLPSSLLPKSAKKDIQDFQDEINQRTQGLFQKLLNEKQRILFHESLNDPERQIRQLIDRNKKLLEMRIEDIQKQRKHIQKARCLLQKQQKAYEALLLQTGNDIPFFEVQKAKLQRLQKKVESLSLHSFVQHSVEIANHQDVISDHRVVSQWAHHEFLDPKSKLISSIENGIADYEVKMTEIKISEKERQLENLIVHFSNLDQSGCLNALQQLSIEAKSMQEWEQSIAHPALSVELKRALYWQSHRWCQQLLQLHQHFLALKSIPVEAIDPKQIKGWGVDFERLFKQIESSNPDQSFIQIGVQATSCESYALWSKALQTLQSSFENLPAVQLLKNKTSIQTSIHQEESPIFKQIRYGQTQSHLDLLDTVRGIREALQYPSINSSIFYLFKDITSLYPAKMHDFTALEISKLKYLELILKVDETLKRLSEFDHVIVQDLSKSLALTRQDLVDAYQNSFDVTDPIQYLESSHQQISTQIEQLYSAILSKPITELKTIEQKNSPHNIWTILMRCLISLKQSLFGKSETEIQTEMEIENKKQAMNAAQESQFSFKGSFFSLDKVNEDTPIQPQNLKVFS